MATVTVGSGFGIDMRILDYSTFYYGYDYVEKSTLFTIIYSAGNFQEFKGRGFKYNSSGEPTAGVVTNYAITIGGHRALWADGLDINATEIVKAARTYSTADDHKVLQHMLDGSDTIKGAGRGDTLYSYDGNDKVFGNGGADTIYGGNGKDTLDGGSGNDILHGGGGVDTLYGGNGSDKLYGEGAGDIFQFKSYKDSSVSSSGRDTIYDFSGSGGDKIDLHLIDANTKSTGNQAFKFIGAQQFHDKAGELRFEKLSSDTYVYGDINGDGNADFAIHLDDALKLVGSNFDL